MIFKFGPIALLVLVVLVAISSYMSLIRNSGKFNPRKLEENIRLKSFMHLETKAPDISSAPVSESEELRELRELCLSVSAVRRAQETSHHGHRLDTTRQQRRLGQL